MPRLLHGLCLLVWLSFAQSGPKPDFSSAWQLNLAKSQLEIAPPDSSVFYIDHKEPLFRLKRTHVFNGKPNTWEIELTTDGKEVVQQEKDADFHARLRWDGEATGRHSPPMDGSPAPTSNTATSGSSIGGSQRRRIGRPRDGRSQAHQFLSFGYGGGNSRMIP
ncbi:MAG: hypothetical protein GY953_00665 [bacterium]|nr:hypothetical protein [bacterium]